MKHQMYCREVEDKLHWALSWYMDEGIAGAVELVVVALLSLDTVAKRPGSYQNSKGGGVHIFVYP